MKYAVFAALLAAGCVTTPSEQINLDARKRADAVTQLNAITAECQNRKLSGELKSWAQVHDCAQPRQMALLESGNIPDSDIIALYLKETRVSSEKLDAGKITEAQAELEYASSMERMNDKIWKRDADRNIAAQNDELIAAQRQQSSAALMATGNSLLQAAQPQQPQRLQVNCTTAQHGNFGHVNCY